MVRRPRSSTSPMRSSLWSPPASRFPCLLPPSLGTVTSTISSPACRASMVYGTLPPPFGMSPGTWLSSSSGTGTVRSMTSLVRWLRVGLPPGGDCFRCILPMSSCVTFCSAFHLCCAASQRPSSPDMRISTSKSKTTRRILSSTLREWMGWAMISMPSSSTVRATDTMYSTPPRRKALLCRIVTLPCVFSSCSCDVASTRSPSGVSSMVRESTMGSITSWRNSSGDESSSAGQISNSRSKSTAFTRRPCTAVFVSRSHASTSRKRASSTP
mmetsp:Transcript_9403/g.27620  ORF Transcript_9403/g.27620 Transcript_9403/m.27620 type:complete len:270 (+) Transcript_9403:6158-6967(+)